MKASGCGTAGRAAGIVSLLLSLYLVGCSRPSDEPLLTAPPQSPSPSERARVLDGDVVIVDGVSLRLANAYAPQPMPYARCWAEAVAAKQVRSKVRTMISEAARLETRTTPDRDEYNRPLAYITLDGLDLGDTLYDMGLAARRTPSGFRWCAGFSEETNGAPTLKALMEPLR